MVANQVHKHLKQAAKRAPRSIREWTLADTCGLARGACLKRAELFTGIRQKILAPGLGQAGLEFFKKRAGGVAVVQQGDDCRAKPALCNVLCQALQLRHVRSAARDTKHKHGLVCHLRIVGGHQALRILSESGFVQPLVSVLFLLCEHIRDFDPNLRVVQEILIDSVQVRPIPEVDKDGRQMACIPSTFDIIHGSDNAIEILGSKIVQQARFADAGRRWRRTGV